MAPQKQTIGQNDIAKNRKARFEYEIIDTLEAGIVLTGTEVKSLRAGKAQVAEAYASCEDGELWLINSHIEEYRQGNRENHEPRRRRKLLVHRKELSRLKQAVAREGMTLIPLRLYFNDGRRAKVELALAKGKNNYDKRQTEKSRDWDREKGRLLKAHG